MLRITKGQRVLLSGTMIVIALIFEKVGIFNQAAVFLMIAAAFTAGYPIALNAIRSLRYRILGIDALVTAAVTGALLINEYWEAAAVTFLFMLGSYLESKTLEKSRSAIKALMDSAPKNARVLREDREIELPFDDVVKGDIVIIRPGEKIPVDGTVVEGAAYVNQAPITGESMPVNRTGGDSVFSGTVIESGYLKVRAEKVGDDTSFSRILQMVEEAQDKKARAQKFLEVFSRYYTPSIMVLAAAVFLITKDVELSLTLLVIACPGALVISTPVSIVAGIGNGARNGVLIKGGEIIEKLGTIKVLAFDKTGTLTEGRPKVTRINAIGMSDAELLKIAAGAEIFSEHPLAKAILRESIETPPVPEASQIITGQGVKAEIEGKTVLVGSRKLISDSGIEIPDDIAEYVKNEEDKGKTVVFVSQNGRIAGLISIADTIREGAAELIRKIKAMGIKKVVMLTGDNKRAAAAIAKELGLDECYSELLPEDKVSVLKRLRKEFGTAAMVGDGINDAPALASADLGIAMGGAGKDAAMETADAVIMSDEIAKLSYAVGLSRATVKNMKQNIYFAIIIVGMLLAGVLAKTVFLSVGMLIHELSVLAVILNAVRLLGFREMKSFSRSTNKPLKHIGIVNTSCD